MMTIQFQFDSIKAVESAALLLKFNGRSMNYMGLLKMLYIADRKALEKINFPIIGDQYYSLDYGPILSSVYDLIKGFDVKREGVKGASHIWQKYISTRPKEYKNENYYKVRLLKDPGVQELCQDEEEILEEVYSKFAGIDPFEVAKWTHELPEWKNPFGSRIPIEVENVLKYLKKTNEEITQISQEIDEERYIRQII